ncbi:hypothetical protein ES705_29412 [subsurface metagenome]
MKAVLHTIDLVSDWTAKVISWLAVALVVVLVFDVVERYVFGGATIWAYETGVMLGATIYIMGWAYVHRIREHIRVDVFYVHLSPRVQVIIDIVGTLLFLLPLLYVMIDTSIFLYGACLGNWRGIVGDFLVPTSRSLPNHGSGWIVPVCPSNCGALYS